MSLEVPHLHARPTLPGAAERPQAHGLSQDGAGKLVGLLPKTISALENRPGSATIESLLKLLSALDLELVIAPKKETDPENQNTSPSVEDW